MDSICDQFYDMALDFWNRDYEPDDFFIDVRSLFEEAWEMGYEKAKEECEEMSVEETTA